LAAQVAALNDPADAGWGFLERPESDATAPPPVPHGMVLRRFRPPVPVEVRADPGKAQPVELRSAAAAGLVTALRGPWCGSGDWWTDRAWSRREWDVQLSGGQLCRICEENGEWLLEGIYD
jgi:protein ImuB